MYNAGRATKQPYFQNIAIENEFIDMLTKPYYKISNLRHMTKLELIINRLFPKMFPYKARLYSKQPDGTFKGGKWHTL